MHLSTICRNIRAVIIHAISFQKHCKKGIVNYSLVSKMLDCYNSDGV